MMSGRGRGARNGAVSIKVERVVRNQGHQENGGVYEDEVVYVTEGPRRRGRPRKPATVTRRPPPKTLPQQFPRSNEVIYVSAARGRPQYVIPPRIPVQPSIVQQTPQRAAAILQGARQLSVFAAVCPRPVKCIVSGTPAGQTIVNVPKPVLNPGVQRKNEERKINWPSDLQELVSHWDNFPERRTRDVVKWFFQTVNSKSVQPKTVREIQAMWSSMPETWEEKVDLALEWLRDSEPSLDNVKANPTGVATTSSSVLSQLKSAALASMSRAKVLVEAQPNHIQDCGQWSSLAENRENCNH